jgi:hypothetical protein
MPYHLATSTVKVKTTLPLAGTAPFTEPTACFAERLHGVAVHLYNLRLDKRKRSCSGTLRSKARTAELLLRKSCRTFAKRVEAAPAARSGYVLAPTGQTDLRSATILLLAAERMAASKFGSFAA